MNTATAAGFAPFVHGRNEWGRTRSAAASYPGRLQLQSDSCCRSSPQGSAWEWQDCSACTTTQSGPAEATPAREGVRASADSSPTQKLCARFERTHPPTTPNMSHGSAIRVRAASGPDRCRCTRPDLPALARDCSPADMSRRSSAAIIHATQGPDAARTRRHSGVSSKTPATMRDSAGNNRSSARAQVAELKSFSGVKVRLWAALCCIRSTPRQRSARSQASSWLRRIPAPDTARRVSATQYLHRCFVQCTAMSRLLGTRERKSAIQRLHAGKGVP